MLPLCKKNIGAKNHLLTIKVQGYLKYDEENIWRHDIFYSLVVDETI